MFAHVEVLFVVNLWKYTAKSSLELFRSIVNLYLFDSLMGEPETPHFMMSGFLDVSLSPKTNIVLSFETPGYLK